MSYEHFTEYAPSHREVEILVREKYKDSAIITSRRDCRKGGFLGIGGRKMIEVKGYRVLKPIATNQGMQQVHQIYTSPSQSLNQSKHEILKAAGQSDSITMNKLLSEVKDLRKDLVHSNTVDSVPESMKIVDSFLKENEFTPKFCKHIQDKCRTLSLEDLDNPKLVQTKVLRWVEEQIFIAENLPSQHPRIIVLVGPTGVGKTTTIAKLAGLYKIGEIDGKKRSVCIITTDDYRIGAYKQLETYAQIMSLPLKSVRTSIELKQAIAEGKNAEVIFIDTPGRSPRDFENLARLNSILQACGKGAEILLTLSASTRYSDLRQIIQQFEAFNFASIILTKIDEVTSLGSVISVLWEKRKQLSYLCYGQNVPKEIDYGSVQLIMKNIIRVPLQLPIL